MAYENFLIVKKPESLEIGQTYIPVITNGDGRILEKGFLEMKLINIFNGRLEMEHNKNRLTVDIKDYFSEIPVRLAKKL